MFPILMAFCGGLGLGAAAVAWHFHDARPSGALRHTIDHRCDPPYSRWSSFDDDYCAVDILAFGKHVMPGDVWDCECLSTYIANDGQWKLQPRRLEEGAA